MLCIRCGGTGRYLGNGMMMADCNLCDDGQYLPEKSEKSEKSEKNPKINRKSASYKKAIKDIMLLNQEISRDEAVKMFDSAYNKE